MYLYVEVNSLKAKGVMGLKQSPYNVNVIEHIFVTTKVYNMLHMLPTMYVYMYNI